MTTTAPPISPDVQALSPDEISLINVKLMRSAYETIVSLSNRISVLDGVINDATAELQTTRGYQAKSVITKSIIDCQSAVTQALEQSTIIYMASLRPLLRWYEIEQETHQDNDSDNDSDNYAVSSTKSLEPISFNPAAIDTAAIETALKKLENNAEIEPGNPDE